MGHTQNVQTAGSRRGGEACSTVEVAYITGAQQDVSSVSDVKRCMHYMCPASGTNIQHRIIFQVMPDAEPQVFAIAIISNGVKRNNMLATTKKKLFSPSTIPCARTAQARLDLESGRRMFKHVSESSHT